MKDDNEKPEKITDDAARDFQIAHLYELVEKIEKNPQAKDDNEILKQLYKLRVGQLDLREKYTIWDNFLLKGWKLIITLVGIASIVSYSIAVYHHESSLKPLLFDIVKAIFGKLGGV